MTPVYLYKKGLDYPPGTRRVVMYAPNDSWADYIALNLNRLYGLKPGVSEYWFNWM